jgi:SAM-dependent methyltransferase
MPGMSEATFSRQYVKWCDLADFDDPVFRATVHEFVPDLEPDAYVHRKYWEYAMLGMYLADVGMLRDDCAVLSVGAGHESPVYWLANRVRRVAATDLYGSGHFVSWEARGDMLSSPDTYAPFPYRQDRLEVYNADARSLPFDADSFDVVYSLSSIEHFGSHEDIIRATREMARVLKPLGHLIIVTEGFLRRHVFQSATVQTLIRLASGGRRFQRASWGDRDDHVFTGHELQKCVIEPSGMTLVQPLARGVSAETFENTMRYGPGGEVRSASGQPYPHIVLAGRAGPWTSVFLAFEGQAGASVGRGGDQADPGAVAGRV